LTNEDLYLKTTHNTRFKPVSFAILAAALYGISAPISKMLLNEISPYMLAALLYLGAGIGMLIINTVKLVLKKERTEAKITKNELPFVILMILLDIAAPILLMVGLSMTTASSASLLNNFEIVATSLIALMIFKEAVGKRMWVAIALITLASVILSVKDFSNLSFSMGSVFIVLACISWGFENNCTRRLSHKDPVQVVIIKGFGSGAGALIIALVYNKAAVNIPFMFIALALGFLAFGMSIFFYIKAQRDLGAARTSAYYAAAPFIGVIISWIVLRETISITFFIALAIMLLGTYFAVSEKHKHTHLHLKTTHEHKHSHDDMHHTHKHEDNTQNEHSHEHTHKKGEHKHTHTPDIHHRHKH